MAEAFNPDKFLAETEPQQSQVFNPDKFLTETNPNRLPTADELINPSREVKASALKGAGQILDYPGGLVRTAVAGAGGLLTGNPNAVQGKDVIAALHGDAPKSSEYMKRLGVPEGPSVDLPFIGPTSARDVAGLAGDIVTDPLTHGARFSKALNLGGEITEAAGKNMYKSGFKKIDERLAEKGKGKLGDLLLEEGAPTGTTKQIAEKTKAMAGGLSNERQGLYDQATAKGAVVDLGYPLKNVEDHLAKIRQDPGLVELADKLQEKLDLYKKAGKVTIDKLSDWKSNIYNSLPDSAYGANGVVKGPAKDFSKKLGQDFRQAIIDAGNKVEAGLGDKIDAVNDKWSTLIGSEKPTAMQIRRGETPNLVTSVDAILSGHPGLLATKKAADAAKTTYLRTKVGKGLMDAGKSGAAQGLMNRGLINNSRGLVNGQN